jgi:hypothetical protein
MVTIKSWQAVHHTVTRLDTPIRSLLDAGSAAFDVGRVIRPVTVAHRLPA